LKPFDIPEDVAKSEIGLQNNQLKLVELIESLGEYINNEEPTIRAKGILY
jgi:DNA repair/transcription protein MET18/MMS19